MGYKKFYNLEEIEKYYVPETNTYRFEENGLFLNVVFMFDINVESNICANNILAKDIVCLKISTVDIDAYDIKATKLIANNIKALAVKVRDTIVYSGEINIGYSVVCGQIIYNKLSNW